MTFNGRELVTTYNFLGNAVTFDKKLDEKTA